MPRAHPGLPGRRDRVGCAGERDEERISLRVDFDSSRFAVASRMARRCSARSSRVRLPCRSRSRVEPSTSVKGRSPCRSEARACPRRDHRISEPASIVAARRRASAQRRLVEPARATLRPTRTRRLHPLPAAPASTSRPLTTIVSSWQRPGCPIGYRRSSPRPAFPPSLARRGRGPARASSFRRRPWSSTHRRGLWRREPEVVAQLVLGRRAGEDDPQPRSFNSIRSWAPSAARPRRSAPCRASPACRGSRLPARGPSPRRRGRGRAGPRLPIARWMRQTGRTIPCCRKARYQASACW